MAQSNKQKNLIRVHGSIQANVKFMAIADNIAQIQRTVPLLHHDYKKYANKEYNVWFTEKRGHEQASKILNTICEQLKKVAAARVWKEMTRKMRTNVFFIHVTYGFLLHMTKENNTDVMKALEKSLMVNAEQVISNKSKIFKTLAMDLQKRKEAVCKAMLDVIKEESLQNDFGLTIARKYEQQEVTHKAYNIAKKHFPHREISECEDLEDIVLMFDEEIAELQRKVETTTEDKATLEARIQLLQDMNDLLKSSIKEKETNFKAHLQLIDNKFDQKFGDEQETKGLIQQLVEKVDIIQTDVEGLKQSQEPNKILDNTDRGSGTPAPIQHESFHS